MYLEGRGIVHRDLAARNVLGKLFILLNCGFRCDIRDKLMMLVH